MKIAVVTTDTKTVAKHFGRAPFFKIFTINDGKITNTEIRARKTGHFSAEHQHSDKNEEIHGYGEEKDKKHDKMAFEISDCQVLIAGGMGRGAYQRFFFNGINVIMTDEENIERAIEKYINGKLVNLYEKLTH